MSVCSVLIIYFGILAFYKILKYIAMYCNIYTGRASTCFHLCIPREVMKPQALS